MTLYYDLGNLGWALTDAQMSGCPPSPRLPIHVNMFPTRLLTRRHSALPLSCLEPLITITKMLYTAEHLLVADLLLLSRHFSSLPEAPSVLVAFAVFFGISLGMEGIMNFNERFPAARRAKRRFRGNRKSGSPLSAHRVASYQPRVPTGKKKSSVFCLRRG